MSKTRPSNYEVKNIDDLKNWFEKKTDSFCYVNGKIRQSWYIGHNNLNIAGINRQLDFKDLTGGVWRVTVKEIKTDDKKAESTEGDK